MADNQVKATSARVLMLFTFLLAGVTAAAWRQRSAQPGLETVGYPTALGDVQYCPVNLLDRERHFSAQLDHAAEVAEFSISSEESFFRRDDRMFKAGMATSREFFLYQRDDLPTESLWVKSADGQYHRIQRVP